jgi:hypothetical protein
VCARRLRPMSSTRPPSHDHPSGSSLTTWRLIWAPDSLRNVGVAPALDREHAESELSRRHWQLGIPARQAGGRNQEDLDRRRRVRTNAASRRIGAV